MVATASPEMASLPPSASSEKAKALWARAAARRRMAMKMRETTLM
jgi:hypothetical protein